MKYKCLVLDHDDTVVNSTATVHFPSFLCTLHELRPQTDLTLEEYFSYNFDPGFSAFCEKILGFTDEEMDIQLSNWLAYVSEHIPEAFAGISDILWEFKRRGGYICVSSHSVLDNILRDYKANNLPEPDMIFGWDLLPEQRKPSPYALTEIMKAFGLKPQELVMIDDLKPGKDMADLVGVDFIGAGWAHSVPKIEKYMREHCKHYCKSPEDLKKIIF